MKLRNKKTGEIVMVCKINPEPYEARDFECSSLAKLNEEWEDYEEPKDHWYINYQGEVYVLDPKAVPEYSRNAKEIGNYFETKEEAEKALEKLKAWKRLEKCNFRFKGYDDKDRGICGDIIIFAHVYTNGNLIDEAQPSMLKDLDTLFGGDK